MIIGSCEVEFYAPFVTSLKEKRMIVKSIISKTRHKFLVSIAEVDNMDSHKTIVIGFAVVTNERRHADSMIQNILSYMEQNTDADMILTKIDIF